MNRNCGALLLGAKMENVIHGFLFDFLTPSCDPGELICCVIRSLR